MNRGILIGLLALAIIWGWKEHQPRMYYPKQNNQSFYLESKDQIGTCRDSTLRSSVDIYVVSDLGNAAGVFDANLKIISLVSTTTEVIAHEVSHLVDYIVMERKISDGETRAYLQGFYTQCIENALELDQKWKEYKTKEGYNNLHRL